MEAIASTHCRNSPASIIASTFSIFSYIKYSPQYAINKKTHHFLSSIPRDCNVILFYILSIVKNVDSITNRLIAIFIDAKQIKERIPLIALKNASKIAFRPDGAIE